MKTFYILDHKFLPTPYNHRFFVEKFSRGFGYHGFDVRIVSDIKQIKESGFVMISSHYFFHKFGFDSLNPNDHFKNILRKLFSFINYLDKTGIFVFFCRKFQNKTVKKLAEHIKDKNIVLIAWFWFDRADFLKNICPRVIFTGEYHYAEPVIKSSRKWYQFYKNRADSLPIEFAADLDPRTLEFGKILKDLNVGFVGNKNYKPDWYKIFYNNRDCAIIPTPPYISEEKRVDVYKRSKIILGFHSKDNIDNHVVVERVFESLAYGSVCITDNPDAPLVTNGCAIYVKDKEDLLSVVKNILSNSNLFESISQKGINFSKERGTYYYQASKFINLSKTLFGEVL